MNLIHDDIKDQIISSARKLTSEKNAVKITVRDILRDLNITNRVFYNRFHNIDEVMALIYEDTNVKLRESISIPWNQGDDFFSHIHAVAERALILNYENRKNLRPFLFETDDTAKKNYDWWIQEIINLIRIGKESNYLSIDLDEIITANSLWCFIRGFNAEAISRGMPKEEALSQFRYGFDCFLCGLKHWKEQK